MFMSDAKKGIGTMKKGIALILILCMLLSILPSMSFAARSQEEAVRAQAESVETVSVVRPDLVSSQLDLSATHRLFRPELTKSAYWNSTASGSYNKLNTTASNSKNYFASPRMTREDLPIGSVIVVEAGWKYRPEGWVGDKLQSTREAETTRNIVEVTEDWWGNYTYRAFNISKTDNSALTDLTATDIHEAFHI